MSEEGRGREGQCAHKKSQRRVDCISMGVDLGVRVE